MLLADFCNRLLETSTPQIAGFPSRATCAAPTGHRERSRPKPTSDFATADARPPCGNPAPDRCALDGAHPTSVLPFTAAAPRREQLLGEPTFPGRRLPPRRFRPRARPTKETSDAPCRAPTYAPGRSPTPSSRNQNRFHHQRVNAGGFPGTERLPSPSAQQTSFETSEPATDRATLPPRSGFRRCFASPMLSRGGARLEPWFSLARSCESRRGWCEPRAARRLLQSWTTCEHDLEPSEPRAPPVRSPGRAALIAGGAAPPFGGAWPTGRYRARGRAARRYAVCVASLEAIARKRGLSPNPTSTRAPRVASS